MKIKKTGIAGSLLLIVGLLLPGNLFPSSQAGVIFLLIEPGSRPGGMGQAYVAHVDDAFAGYWNPGAMAFNRKTQIAGMHTNWFGDVQGIDDIYLEYLGWNQYFDEIGNIGAHIIFLTYGTQDRTDEHGEFLGVFSSYELAVATTYASQVSPNLGLGLTFKFILSDLAPVGTGAEKDHGIKGRGISYAFDVGIKSKGIDFGQVAVAPYNGVIALYNGIATLGGFNKLAYSDLSASVPNLDFGLNLQNIGPDIVYIDDAQADPLPLNWRMGLSFRAVESEYSQFTINADMNKVLANRYRDFYKRPIMDWFDESFSKTLESAIYNVGAEYTYFNLLSLRAGYIYDKIGDMIGPSFGAGIQHTFTQRYKVSLDFAMQHGGGLVDYNKTFSIGVEF